MSMEIDMREFRTALNTYSESTKRTLPEILNQRALNVAGRAFDAIPPHGDGNNIQAKRQEIQRYLKTPISTRIKVFTSGKRKGKFGRNAARNKQLQRVHLILQARRAKEGKKGLYGAEMMQESGKFKIAAQVSVGFLKSVFLPIIRALNPIVRFKFPFSKTSRISRWPGSAGHGKVNIAKPGWNPFVELFVSAKVQDGQEGKVTAIYQNALQKALNDEAREMERHVLDKLQKEADKVNAR